jgi:hypothetical protein
MKEKTEQKEIYTKTQIAVGKFVAKPLVYIIAFCWYLKDWLKKKAI